VVAPTQSKPLTAYTTTTIPRTTLLVAPSEYENPWLTIQSDFSSKIARKKNEIVVGKSSGLAEKSKHRLRKHQEKHESEREKARDDAVVEISIDDVLNLRPEGVGQVELPPLSKAKEAVTRANDGSCEDSDANSEVEEQERRLVEKRRKGKGKAKNQGAVRPFAQRDLVSLAFAGDKVVQVYFLPKR
jgi:U3 small nucleolar RNA-associated protein 14